MANMSYCRFENTYHDFVDCVEAIEYDDFEELSDSEKRYAKLLYEACERFVGLFPQDELTNNEE